MRKITLWKWLIIANVVLVFAWGIKTYIGFVNHRNHFMSLWRQNLVGDVKMNVWRAEDCDRLVSLHWDLENRKEISDADWDWYTNLVSPKNIFYSQEKYRDGDVLRFQDLVLIIKANPAVLSPSRKDTVVQNISDHIAAFGRDRELDSMVWGMSADLLSHDLDTPSGLALARKYHVR